MRIGPQPHTVDQVTNWLAEIGHLPTAVVMAALGAVMLLDAIPLIGVLIPGDVAVLGAMAARGPAGGAGVLFGVIVGCLAGWSASFLVGRYFGARLRSGRIGSWIGEARWQAAERAVGRTGGRMVMIAPFLPVLNALVPLAAGGLRMSYRRFLGCAAVGGALWAACYVGLGVLATALGDLLPGTSFTAVASMLIGLSLGWVVLLGTRRRLRGDAGAGDADTEGASEPAIAGGAGAGEPVSAGVGSAGGLAVAGGAGGLALALAGGVGVGGLAAVGGVQVGGAGGVGGLALALAGGVGVGGLAVAGRSAASGGIGCFADLAGGGNADGDGDRTDGDGGRVGGGVDRRPAGTATGNLGNVAAKCVAPTTEGMAGGITEAGWVHAAQIPGPDRCHKAGYIRGSRRRPPRAGVDGAARPRTRRRRHPGAVVAACPTVRNRRPVRPAR